MKIWRVGGAVRDRLLGRPVEDVDWVVTGATPEQMAEQGYKPVGKDFPVFLHPKTHEEYALARTERKVARGYGGFSFNTDPSITIEQDLARRDLTINAMAEDVDGLIIDPYGGQRDLEARVLRHVSEAFVEDPLRVLRIARFAARFAHLGFRIAGETCDLIRRIGESGELDALVPERVWVETRKALSEPDPQVYFESLRDCGVLKQLFPEIDALFGVPQTEKYHPEIDTGVHVMMVLKQAALLGCDVDTRYAALTHDLGKATTPKEILPGHRGHEQRGLKILRRLNQRLKVPKAPAELALLTCQYHTHVHRIYEMRPDTILRFLQDTDSFRRLERFYKFTRACLADARGRLGFEDDPYPQADYAWRLAQAMNRLDLTPVIESGLKGKALGEAIRAYRLQYLKTLIEPEPPAAD
ncbi:MAG TPA: multifunctional CCA addition/repair protein [Thiotrichales bacterium]|nr:multifunctional CCA addition/repair protein [Thiotrichales bacterium]